MKIKICINPEEEALLLEAYEEGKKDSHWWGDDIMLLDTKRHENHIYATFEAEEGEVFFRLGCCLTSLRVYGLVLPVRDLTS